MFHNISIPTLSVSFSSECKEEKRNEEWMTCAQHLEWAKVISMNKLKLVTHTKKEISFFAHGNMNGQQKNAEINFWLRGICQIFFGRIKKNEWIVARIWNFWKDFLLTIPFFCISVGGISTKIFLDVQLLYFFFTCAYARNTKVQEKHLSANQMPSEIKFLQQQQQQQNENRRPLTSD